MSKTARKKNVLGAKTGKIQIQREARKEKKKVPSRTCEADVAKEQIHISERQKRLKTEDKEKRRTVKANRNTMLTENT